MMKKFKVRHVVMCEVHAYRVVEAESMSDALGKLSLIETVTATGGDMPCDYEIVGDHDVMSVSVKEWDGK